MATTGEPDQELPAALLAKMTTYRKLYADILDVVAEMDRAGVANRVGYPSLPAFLSHLLHLNTTDAGRMVAQAAQVTQTVTPTGYVRPAPCPTVRQVLHKGELDPRHVDAVLGTLDRLPGWATVEHRELLESTLAETARIETPRTVREHGRILLDRIDQDGPAPHDDQPAETGNLLRYQPLPGGGMRLRGQLDAETAGTLHALLGPLAKPQPQPRGEGIPDPRTPEQRDGDGLAAIIHLAATSGRAPTRGGVKPHLTVTLDYQVLAEQTGTATLDDGTTLPAATARRLACDAHLIPIVLGTNSTPLDLGRTQRLVQPHQRNALITRDKGCAFPTCHLPARWTDAHHLTHWADGGKTNLDNLVLLCRTHHRLIHHGTWSIHMRRGIPWFTPPPEIDPTRQPRRNILRQ
jgi:hypothetical protein